MANGFKAINKAEVLAKHAKKESAKAAAKAKPNDPAKMADVLAMGEGE